MFKRSSNLVIILLLLIQLISCLPRSSSSDSVDSILPETTTITPSVGENAVPSGHNSFEEAFHKGLINIRNFELQRTNQIAKDVLADPSMYNIDNIAMQREISHLRKYVTDSNEALKKVLPAESSKDYLIFARDALDVLDDFMYFYTAYSREQAVITETLKKHGVLEYMEELDNLYNEYFSSLVDEFEKYVVTLSAAEKEKDFHMKLTMLYWNAYKNKKIGKLNFGKKLLDINWRSSISLIT